MSEAATETPTKTRRWNAFVCPGCRLLFRVPKNPEGRGVVCPNCRRLLRLPQKGDEVPVLFDEAAGPSTVGDPVVGMPAESSGLSEGHHHHSRPGLLGKIRDRLAKRRGSNQSAMLAIIIMVLVAFGAIFGLVRLIGGGVARVEDGGERMIEEELPGTGTNQPLIHPGEQDDPELGGSMTIEPGTFLPRAEKMARRLVDSQSVQDMLPVVRDPDRAGPRMRDWYARHGYESRGIHKFADRGALSMRGRMVGVPIVMDDFEPRQMAFLVDGDTLLVDWESWVGWSEVEWSAFMDERPVEGKMFRVYAVSGNYFNFGFKEEEGWRCYELESPDRESLLYGYGKIGSETDNQLMGVEKGQRSTLTLRLRYPENAPSANQVIIESFVATGWVIDEDE